MNDKEQILHDNMCRIEIHPTIPVTTISILREIWKARMESPYMPRAIAIHPRLLSILKKDIEIWYGSDFVPCPDKGIYLFGLPVIVAEWADKDHPEILVSSK